VPVSRPGGKAARFTFGAWNSENSKANRIETIKKACASVRVANDLW
jgi:hypothetical protein